MSRSFGYSTINENGEWINVYDLDDCLESIKQRNKDNECTIKHLKEENAKLKEESYKDEEMQKMNAKLEQMRSDYYRGFPISEEEEKLIEEWKEKHEREVHGIKTDKNRMWYGGSIGGTYSYHFVPTSICTSGVIRCSCGAEFEFKKIE